MVQCTSSLSGFYCIHYIHIKRKNKVLQNLIFWEENKKASNKKNLYKKKTSLKKPSNKKRYVIRDMCVCLCRDFLFFYSRLK